MVTIIYTSIIFCILIKQILCLVCYSNVIFCITVKKVNMYPLSSFIKVTIPNYLSNLPVPDNIGGWFKLGIKDWAALVPPMGFVGGIVYMSYLAFCPESRKNNTKNHVNNKISKQESKVVNSVDIEDIGEKAAFCRCWKSNNWPYCDGAHGKHNAETGDNVGPLIIKHR